MTEEEKVFVEKLRKEIDCLSNVTQPGTPFGECIYNFCGCDIHRLISLVRKYDGLAEELSQKLKEAKEKS